MKALMISRDSLLHAEVAAQGSARMPPMQLVASRNGLRDAVERQLPEMPDLVIVDASDAAPDETELLERLGKLYSSSSFMLLTREPQQDLLIRAMRAGVREVLQLPLVHSAFHECHQPHRSGDGRQCRQAVRWQGAGLHFLQGRQRRHFFVDQFRLCPGQRWPRKKCILIDLHGQFGDATLYVSDQKPAMTLSDVCSADQRASTAPFSTRAWCTSRSSFGDPGRGRRSQSHAIDLKPEQMDIILRVARQHYDFMVLDVGRQIDAISLRALDNADAIYPVLQLALPDLRDGRRLLDIFRSLGYADRKHAPDREPLRKGRASLRLHGRASRRSAPRSCTPCPTIIVAVTRIRSTRACRCCNCRAASPVARSLAELVELVTARRVPGKPRACSTRLFGRVTRPNNKPPGESHDLARTPDGRPTTAARAPSRPKRNLANHAAYLELKKSMHQTILDRIDLERLKRLTPEQFKHELALLVQRVIEEERIVLNQHERHSLVLDIQHEMLGFGPLESAAGRSRACRTSWSIPTTRVYVERARTAGTDRHHLPRQRPPDEDHRKDRLAGGPPGRRIVARWSTRACRTARA